METQRSKSHFRDVAIGFIGGVNGGIATVYVGQPLDTVKVKMQTFPGLHTNALTCFVNTFKKDGIYRGLYAGSVPALAANVAENAVLFGVLEPNKNLVLYMKNQFNNNNAPLKTTCELSDLDNAIAGSLAAFWSSLVLCPTELIKCRQQALREMIESGRLPHTEKGSLGPWSIIKDIMNTDGVRGFFRGLVPTFGREMPGYFFFFGGYELSRSLFANKYQCRKDELGPIPTAICGGIGGVSLWTAIFPFDVIKSRLQISTGESQKFSSITRSILQQEGISALYRGLCPTVLRTFPATGALFVSYEWTKKFFDAINL